MPWHPKIRGRFGPLAVLVMALTASSCSHGGSSERSAAQSTSTVSVPSPRPVDWSALDEALGRKGDVMAGDVHRYGFPRSDLKVTLDGIALKPGFALGSYAAFAATGTRVVVMGDLVLTEAEVSPVMAKLQEQGLEVSALHNHLLREQPKIMYLHYEGRSEDAVALGRWLRASLAASATPMTAPSAPAASDLGFDPAALDQTLGHTGTTSGGLHKYAIARAETVVMGGGNGSPGMPLTPALGVGTVINFQPLGAGKAAISGDFALIGSEVAKVAQTLRANGIEVTAAHTHMTDDSPHLYYMHFFASGPATDLAKGLRAALDVTNSAKG
jgi:biotin operon repressor